MLWSTLKPDEFYLIRVLSFCEIYMSNDVKFFETPCVILQALPLFVHHYEKASDNFKSNLQTIRFLNHPFSPSKSEVAGPMLICISPGKQDYNLALQYLKMCMLTIWYNTLISEM